MAAVALSAAVVLAGCSGRTTGATNVTTSSATLNFIASCGSGERCSWYAQYRVVGTSSWTPVPATPRGPVSGPVSNVPLSENVTGLTTGGRYEYQVCGNSQPGSQFVCVGPDGTPNTTQKFVATDSSGDWAQFHHDTALSGWNPFEVTLNTSNVSSIAPAWVSHVPSTHAGVGSPAVANGVVYVGVFPGRVPASLEAFSAFCGTGGASCSPLWSGTIQTPNVSAAPAVANGMVYVGGGDTLYAFSASGCGSSNCAPLWTGTTGGGGAILSSPTVLAHTVYVGASDGKLYAFDAFGCGSATCGPLLTASTFGPVSAPAALSGPSVHDQIYVGAEQHLYAFQRQGFSGPLTLLWTGATGGAVTAPTTDGGEVYVGSADGKLYAFSGAGLSWTGATGGAIHSAPALAGGVVYVGSDDGKLYAFSASCGNGGAACTPLWTGATGGAIDSAPAVANGPPAFGDGVVYVSSSDGKLYEFPANGCGSATCAPLGTQTPGNGVNPSSSPAVASGAVYIGAIGGNPPPAFDGASVQAYSLP